MIDLKKEWYYLLEESDGVSLWERDKRGRALKSYAVQNGFRTEYFDDDQNEVASAEVRAKREYNKQINK